MPSDRQARAWAILLAAGVVLALLIGACTEVIEAVAESVSEGTEQDDDEGDDD
jgi:hypothetical protein